MERVGTGYAKLLLFGEHAAVYGFPAVGLTLPLATVVKSTAQPGERWRFEDVDTGDSLLLERFFRHLGSFLPAVAEGGGPLCIETTVPRGVGFGSSSALCAAVAHYFASAEASLMEVWRLANRAEEFFHGTPSGIDTGLALSRGLSAFRPSPPELPSIRHLSGFPFYLVVGALPRVESTAKLVGALRKRYSAGNRTVREGCVELGTIARQAIILFDEGSHRREIIGEGNESDFADLADKLGLLMDSAQHVLAELGLSLPSMDRLLAAGAEMGACGGKLSGAGGGGAFYLLFPSASSAKETATRLAEVARSLNITCATPIAAFRFAAGELQPIP